MLQNDLNKALEDIKLIQNDFYDLKENVENELDEELFENKLNSIKSLVLRNTMLNLTNIIERVVEDGSKNIRGDKRQFNVSSVQLGLDNNIYLVTREILGIDLNDKKYVLDNEQSLINFEKINRIF